MGCLLPLAWLALQGEPPEHPGMTAPPRPHWQAPPPPADGVLQICGENAAFHQETQHFTLQWDDPTIEVERVEAIGAYLEQAWAVLVDGQGFPAPVSSDACYLWFYLDPSLSGSGYTTLYYSDAYPDGYPVTWLSPYYGVDEYPDYALSVGIHEFVHMLQYGLEDWGKADNTWYWEASAEWGAELVAPEINTYAVSTYWLARGTDLGFDSMANFHQYGMLVLNAWLDEHVGPEVFRDTWLAARDYPDDGWDVRISGVTGLDFSTIMLGFWGDYTTEALRESALYYPPLRDKSFESIPEEETSSAPGVWGAKLVDFESAGPLAVEAPMTVLYVQGDDWSLEPVTEGPFTAIFIAPEVVPGFFTYGSPDSAPLDSDSEGAPSESETGSEKEPRACGCQSTTRSGMMISAGLLWLMAGRRRGGRRS